MNPIIKKLYTQEELESKIDEHLEKYEESKSRNNYSSMIFECSNIANFYEILEDRKRSTYYYQRIVDEWYAHLRGVPHNSCIYALEKLCRPEEALEVVLSDPKMWDIETLARLYGEAGRREEAILIYSGLAQYSIELSEVCDPFWKPHYLQNAADLYEKVQDFDAARVCNEKAFREWKTIKDSIDGYMYLIEEAWLYEEVGYIYEKAGQCGIALKYYQEAESRYKKAHTEDPSSVADHHIDGDWDRYLEFFIHQIPEFRLIHFHYDGLEKNDYRRIKYRILNLQEHVKTLEQI